jgi:hypothetical protein
MKKLRDGVYRIERMMELQAVVDEYLIEVGEDREDVAVNYGLIPPAFPFLAVIDYSDEYYTLSIEYITLCDFEESSDSAMHLFEFEIERTALESPYTVRRSLYQVPAPDILKAILQLGQTHHRDEVYDLKIVKWNQVR